MKKGFWVGLGLRDILLLRGEFLKKGVPEGPRKCIGII